MARTRETAQDSEVTMPNLLQSFITRLRKYVGDRRRTLRRPARCLARLPCSVSLLDSETGASTSGIAGYTRDLSPTGLTLIVPVIRSGGRYLTDLENKLLLRLELPTGAIQMMAVPVRFEQDQIAAGYLLGVRITEMGRGDHALYIEYLRTLVQAERRSGYTDSYHSVTTTHVSEAFEKFLKET